MTLNRTLSSYLVKEVTKYTSLGFLASIPIILLPNLVDRAGEFLATGITAADQLDIALCVVPLVVAYALPVAFLFGLMMALGRLSGDTEITAMRSCGVGLWVLLMPIFLLGIGVSVITAFLMIDIEPRARRELVALSLRLAARGSLIEEGRFQSFGRRMIFVQKRVDNHRLEEVMISDRSDEDHAFHVFAETGEFSYDPVSGFLRLTLENGDLRMEPNPGNAFEEYRISFSEFDYHFSALKLGMGSLRYRMDQLEIHELWEAVRRIESGHWEHDLKYRNARIYSTQIHRMLSMPFSSVLFVFVGVPLSLAGLVRSRAWGMLLALGLFAGYYASYVYFQDIARYGPFPPHIAIWVPNATLLVIGTVLILNTRRLR